MFTIGTSNSAKVFVVNFDKIWHKCRFRKKNIWHAFIFLSAIVDVEELKTTLEVRSAENILSNTSEITENTVFA